MIATGGLRTWGTLNMFGSHKRNGENAAIRFAASKQDLNILWIDITTKLNIY